MFQSPRSGQICSNRIWPTRLWRQKLFQSPRSGQICSNFGAAAPMVALGELEFQSPRSGQICSNSLKDYSRKNKN